MNKPTRYPFSERIYVAGFRLHTVEQSSTRFDVYLYRDDLYRDDDDYYSVLLASGKTADIAQVNAFVILRKLAAAINPRPIGDRK